MTNADKNPGASEEEDFDEALPNVFSRLKGLGGVSYWIPSPSKKAVIPLSRLYVSGVGEESPILDTMLALDDLTSLAQGILSVVNADMQQLVNFEMKIDLPAEAQDIFTEELRKIEKVAKEIQETIGKLHFVNSPVNK